MKKTFCRLTFVIAVISLCLLAGCAQGTGSIQITTIPASASPQSTAEPSETPALEVSPLPTVSTDEPSEYTDEPSEPLPDETPSPPPISDAEILKTFKEDIDGDGKSETINIVRSKISQSDWPDDIFVYVQDGSDTKETYIDSAEFFESALTTETDNGSICLIVCLGYPDAYYSTYVYSFNASTALLKDKKGGCISEVSGTEITIGGYIDVFGSWGYSRRYDLKNDFTLDPITEYLIKTDSHLHTIKKLPVEMFKNGVYVKQILDEGIYISPESTDGKTYLKFKLEDGSEGRIYYTKNDEYYGFMIEGFSEDEYFDNIEYSG